MHIRKSGGFTIVELLIAITIIAILAAITIVTYKGIRERAQIASVADGLSKVDQSFKLWAIQENFAAWPDEPTYSGGTSLSNMIKDNPGLARNLQEVPNVTGVATEEWFYDNDVISPPSGRCGNMYDGVNIAIRYFKDNSIATGIDKLMDDGNPLCGKIKYDQDAKVLFCAIDYDKVVNN